MERAVDELSAAVPGLDDDQVLAGLLRIVALVSADGRDAHTGLYPWGEGSYALTSLPLRLWVFPDGIHVVDALPPYEDLVGARVTAMGGKPIDEVTATLDPLIPRDNATTVTLLLPRFLLIPEILHGAGSRRHGHRPAVDRGGRRPEGRRHRPDPHGRLQRLGRRLRAPPARRPGRPLPRPGVGAAVVRGRRPGHVYVQYNRVDGVRVARSSTRCGRGSAEARSPTSSSTSATTTAARSGRSGRCSRRWTRPPTGRGAGC